MVMHEWILKPASTSFRIDVVPKEYVKELVMLQDNVPGFPFASAKRIIEEDLGRPLEELYDSFNSIPLAAASLGQVYAFNWCIREGRLDFDSRQKKYLTVVFILGPLLPPPRAPWTT